MGLIEKIHRRVVELGLVPKIIKALPKISLLTTLVAILWFCNLPMDGQYRNTYISENALMPSQAYSYFRESEWNFLRGYRTQLDELKSVSTVERLATVEQWLQDFGMKTATHDNSTLYGIFNAPRADGTEAIVLAAPWVNVDGELNIGGTAVAINLMRYFSRWPVWSKNLILVLSEDPAGSLKSWVDAYHTSLDLTGGSIEAAIVVDYSGSNDYFEYIEVLYEGLNGELPNLDLVNVAVMIAQHEGLSVSMHKNVKPSSENDYQTRFAVMAEGIKELALAGLKPTNGHEAFSGWRIAALTLKAHGAWGVADITTFGRVPEAIFRSVNNLLEKFHQSFFFYILVAPRLFVSIGDYLPAVVALSVSFAIAALSNILAAGSSLPASYTILPLLFLAVVVVISFVVAQLLLIVPQLAQFVVVGSLAIALLPLFANKFMTKLSLKQKLAYRFKAVAFLFFSLVLTSLLVVNFSLAMLMGVAAWPLTIVKPAVVPRDRLKNTIALIVCCPFVSLALLAMYQNYEPEHYITAMISGWKVLGCWTWFVITMGWLPTWLLVVYSSFESSEEHAKLE